MQHKSSFIYQQKYKNKPAIAQFILISRAAKKIYFSSILMITSQFFKNEMSQLIIVVVDKFFDHIKVIAINEL